MTKKTMTKKMPAAAALAAPGELGTLEHYTATLDALEAARAACEASGIDWELIANLEDAAHAEALSGMSCDLWMDDKPAQTERTRRELARHAAAVAKTKVA
jgi:hypothetical protein